MSGTGRARVDSSMLTAVVGTGRPAGPLSVSTHLPCPRWSSSAPAGCPAVSGHLDGQVAVERRLVAQPVVPAGEGQPDRNPLLRGPVVPVLGQPVGRGRATTAGVDHQVGLDQFDAATGAPGSDPHPADPADIPVGGGVDLQPENLGVLGHPYVRQGPHPGRQLIVEDRAVPRHAERPGADRLQPLIADVVPQGTDVGDRAAGGDRVLGQAREQLRQDLLAASQHQLGMPGGRPGHRATAQGGPIDDEHVGEGLGEHPCRQQPGHAAAEHHRTVSHASSGHGRPPQAGWVGSRSRQRRSRGNPATRPTAFQPMIGEDRRPEHLRRCRLRQADLSWPLTGYSASGRRAGPHRARRMRGAGITRACLAVRWRTAPARARRVRPVRPRPVRQPGEPPEARSRAGLPPEAQHGVPPDASSVCRPGPSRRCPARTGRTPRGAQFAHRGTGQHVAHQRRGHHHPSACRLVADRLGR